MRDLILVAGILSAICIGCASPGNKPSPQSPSPPPSTTSVPRKSQNIDAEKTPTVEAPGVATFVDGSHIVGSDIKPATYRTRTRSPGCYWARQAGFSGQIGDILANGNESGPAIVTIKPSDKGFDSRGCGTWTADLSPITPAPDAPFSDGTYIVGADIAPGTWKSDSPENCYWVRMKGFVGGLGEIIANANGKGIVTIAKTDKGFRASKCGTWTKVN